MRRYILTLILLLCLTFAVTGCGKKADKEGQNSSEQSDLEKTEMEEASEESTAAPMQVQESTVIEIGEDQEGSVTPD